MRYVHFAGGNERPEQSREGVQHGRQAEEHGGEGAAAKARQKARPEPPPAAAPDLDRPGRKFIFGFWTIIGYVQPSYHTFVIVLNFWLARIGLF